MWRGNDDGIWEYCTVVAVNAYFVKPLIETSVTPAAWRRQAQPATMFDSLLLHFLSLVNWCMLTFSIILFVLLNFLLDAIKLKMWYMLYYLFIV